MRNFFLMLLFIVYALFTTQSCKENQDYKLINKFINEVIEKKFSDLPDMYSVFVLRTKNNCLGCYKIPLPVFIDKKMNIIEKKRLVYYIICDDTAFISYLKEKYNIQDEMIRYCKPLEIDKYGISRSYITNIQVLHHSVKDRNIIYH